MVKTVYFLLLLAGLCKGDLICTYIYIFSNILFDYLGAPISNELDAVYLLSNADSIVSALGGMRVKRDANYDKEFVIDKYGLGLGLSYNERSDKAGKFYFKLKDVSHINSYIFYINTLCLDKI